MQTRSKILDDISQLMTNAMGVAQGARDEAETAVKGLLDRWLADRNFVTREFDAVRAMAQKAREENEALKARLDALPGRPAGRVRACRGLPDTPCPILRHQSVTCLPPRSGAAFVMEKSLYRLCNCSHHML